jgi:O-acetylhomoserine (thiol)-lyase
MKDVADELGFDTLQLHAGQEDADAATGARAVPIYATSSYVFDGADHAEAVFSGEVKGNQYGRMHNPTVQVFAERLAALEGAKSGLALSSGQAATTTTMLALARPGGHLIVSKELFGGTFSVTRRLLEPWGCRVSAVAADPEEIAAAVTPETVGVWLETIANPSGTVPDLAAIAQVTRANEVPLLVDNTWGCAGYLCRPIDHGADIVVHSATKWIGGHGTFVGGAILDAGTFTWPENRFPAYHKQDQKGRTYVSRAGTLAFSLRAYELGLFTMGMTLSPFTAFLGLQGLETLSLRVQRSCDSAAELARWFERRAEIETVLYPGLKTHPSHTVATKTLTNGYGAVFCFETQESATAKAFLDNTRLASHLANIGDAKTVIINPWTTTHASLPEPERLAAGVTPNLVRVSVGLERVDDLKRDFAQALETVNITS